MRYYLPSGTAYAFTTATDIFEVVAPSDAVVVLESIELGQTTELGDAAEEQLIVSIIRGFTTSGSGGASGTPVAAEGGQSAAGSTCEVRNTTPATTSGTTVAEKPWNVRAPFLWLPPEEHRIIVNPSQRVVVNISTPADSVTVFGELVFSELGGS